MHVSIPVENTVEFINFTQVIPLISKCYIKVLYVGENRNKTFISKELAAEMGKKLPGSPIVGYYNADNKDFEQHNREIEIKDGKLTDNYVSPVVMSGYVPDLLKSISMVSDDFVVTGMGSCGKGYKEWVRVSDGGPALKVKVKLG